ncbi:maleylpyruvate isomerase family mycothiol-dependent enzyme [Nocardiopsis potens]|uniref:maleylpyruvate isomerase family mycothiol-dependent enzyme n=1 Tax=Nocardiopsis potens TaxID=1246458 RepID=UPI000348D25F|nr:maleylpyruvate isomerase family mycothiol-dependent enzyme [Nocardiopsis potens]
MPSIPSTSAATFRQVVRATDRARERIGALTDEDVRAPSLLPGWSRGHVLSHLARQAEGLGRLLEWARTGVENPQYPDRASRDAEIEAGAHRPAAELAADVAATAQELNRAFAELPAPAWSAEVRPFSGGPSTPERILVFRLRELAVHLVDLDVGTGFADLPGDECETLLGDLAAYYRRHPDTPAMLLRDDSGAEAARFGSGGAEVTGSRADLLAWLTGRSPGTGLTAAPALPALPPWI